MEARIETVLFSLFNQFLKIATRHVINALVALFNCPIHCRNLDKWGRVLIK